MDIIKETGVAIGDSCPALDGVPSCKEASDQIMRRHGARAGAGGGARKLPVPPCRLLHFSPLQGPFLGKPDTVLDSRSFNIEFCRWGYKVVLLIDWGTYIFIVEFG
jgi:hypothetical protein